MAPAVALVAGVAGCVVARAAAGAVAPEAEAVGAVLVVLEAAIPDHNPHSLAASCGYAREPHAGCSARKGRHPHPLKSPYLSPWQECTPMGRTLQA